MLKKHTIEEIKESIGCKEDCMDACKHQLMESVIISHVDKPNFVIMRMKRLWK